MLNVDAIAGDSIINIAEKAAGFDISGDTGTETGVSISVEVSSTTLTTTSADDAGTATWTVSVASDATYITGASVDVTVSASKTGYTSPGDIQRTLTIDLTAPAAPSYTAPATLAVGTAITPIIPSGGSGIDEYGATGLPSGLSFDTGTGVISGTPDTADASTADATVTVSDSAGNPATVDIAFPAVARGDQTLSGFQYSASSVTLVDTAPTVTTPSGAVTDISYSAEPATVCTVDDASGVLTLVGAGECVVTATAAATVDYNEGTATYTVTVQTAGNLVLNVGAIATDNIINIAEKASGFNISGDTGTESGVSVSVVIGSTTLTTTSADDAGTATWSVSVPSGATYIAGTSIGLTVSAAKTGFTAPSDVQRTLTVDLAAPTAPTYAAPSSLKVGEAITPISPLGGAGIDEYSAAGLPSGLSLDDSTGVISGTPDTADASTADATVTMSDTAGNPATVDITFPAVGKGDQMLTGFSYSASSVTLVDAAPTVTPPSGAVTDVSYLAEPATVCTVDPLTGALTLVGAGECEITATAEGTADYNEGTATYTVTVQTAGVLVLNVGAIADDNIINIAEKASGFNISGDTGTESGVSVSVVIGSTTLTTTSADDAGTATWSVSVPSGATYIAGTSIGLTVSAAKTGFTAPSDVQRTLTVDLAAPTAPTYAAPSSLQVGEAITPISPLGGAGIDEYSATGLPSGLSLDAGTGVISGTPDTADANTADATVTVSDTAGNTAEVPITFPAVDKGDQTLSGFQYSASSVTLVDTAPTVTAPSGAVADVSYLAEPATVCTVDPLTGALTLVGAGSCEITATAEGTDDYNEGTATYTVTVQTAGVLVLNVSAIAGDNIINIAEKASGFDISGDTGSEGGVSVTVTVGTTDLTATSSSADPATWSVSVAADATYITGTSLIVEVNATKTGFTAPAAITRPLTVDLTAPTAPSYTAPATLTVGTTIAPISPAGGASIDGYSVTGLPSGLSLDAGTGVLSGTPDTADANTADATVTVSDIAGNTAEVPITFPAVDKGDQTLSGFQYSASSVTLVDTAPTVTAPSGAVADVSYLAEPATVCTVDPLTGALTLVGAGSCEITATAEGTDDYNEGTATYTVTVQTAGVLVLNVGAIATDNIINLAEKAAGFDISGDTGSEGGVSVTVTVGTTDLTATSSSADPAIWSVSVPSDATYITGVSVAVTVSAAKTGYTSPSNVQRTLTVDLTAPTAPSYTAPATLAVGTAITPISPSGGAGIDEYSATGLPSGLSLDTGTGVISGTPDTADANSASATVTVGDTAGNTATATIPFPAVSKGDQTLTGFGYSASSVTFGSAAPALTAPTGAQTTLSYSAAPSTVCTVNDSTGALTLVSTGACTITAKAEGSADYNEATAPFTVTVQAAGNLVLNASAIATDNIINIAEKAAGFDISGDTGTEISVDVTVQIGTETLTTTSADDAGTATWSVSVPSGATYIAGTSIGLTVSAAKTGFTAPSDVQRTLTVDLTAPTAPSYTAPLSLQVGEAITLISPLGGFGIDEYAVTGLPSGLSFDTGTGVISGTPDTANASTASATVTVSDTAGNTATATIPFPAVAKGDQTLTGFSYSASSVTLVDAAPTVTAPSGAVTDVSYLAEPATVCTVDPPTGALTLVGAGECEITATAEGTADYNEGTATYTVTVQTAGVLVLNVGAIATDNIINIAEEASGFDISGDTGTESGVSVSVEIGSTTLTTTSVDDAGTATWTVSIPADATYITGASVDVTVSASKTGYSAPGDVERTLTIDLTAPSAPSYTAPASLQVDVAITSMTPSGGVDVNAYAVTSLPSGLVIDAGSGVISGTPDTADASAASATVTVSDEVGNTAAVSITFPAVGKSDQTLSGFEYSSSSIAFGSAAPTVTAPKGAQSTLSYSAFPSTVCTVNSSSGALTIVGVGSCEITATATSDINYNEAEATFTMTVQATGALVLNLNAIAGDDTINIAEKASGFSISGDTGTEIGVAVTVEIGTETLTDTSTDDAGTATWSVSVSGGATYITGTSVDVSVSASKSGFTSPGAVERSLTVDLTAPTAPIYTAPASLQVGVAIPSMTPSGGADIDGYGVIDLPSGLVIDAGSGAISGTPDTADTNTTSATVTVSDTAGNPATVLIAFPSVDKGDQTLSGFQYSSSSIAFGSAAPTVTAPSGVETTLSYSATPSAVCSVDSSTGQLTLVGVGRCEITATAASDSNYNEAEATFTVTVQASSALVLNVDAVAVDEIINIAEKASGFDITGDTGSQGGMSVTVTVGATELTATSADADPATWSVSIPADASYITGTSIGLTVSASKSGFAGPGDVQRTLTVDLSAPTAPTYPVPSLLKVDMAIPAMGPSGGSGIAEYSATGLPSGLIIDSSTGVISGTPDTADTNTTSATVAVSDAAGNTDTVSITFPAVDKGDQTLNGFNYSASSAMFGDSAPTVTAPTGAQTTLSYSATPSTVCMVDSSTGALTIVSVGRCEITATAVGTDDYNEAAATFAVTVQAAGALVELSAAPATVDESGAATMVTVTGTLVGEPRSTATAVSVSVGAPGDAATEGVDYATVSDVMLTIEAGQTTGTVDVTLTPIDDDIVEGAETLTVAGTTGVEDLAVTATVFTIRDNERGVLVSPTSLSVSEGGSASYSVVLTSRPSGTVKVTLSDPSGTDLQRSRGLIWFSRTNWSVAQTVTVTAHQDDDAEDDTVTLSHRVSGADYGVNGVTADSVSVTIDDDDEATGALVLNVNAIAGDNTVNIAEKASGFSIGGDTGSVGGMSVTVTVGSTDLMATSSDADPATWAVSVPADASYITGTSVDVEVNASKTGYATPTAVERTLTVDLTAPAAPTYTAPAALTVGTAIRSMSPSGGSGIAEYGATGLLSGLTINTTSGVISGTPDMADADTASATVTVSDQAGNTAAVSITFPAVAKGDQTLTGFQYSASSVAFGSAAPTVTAPSGVQTTLSYSAAPSTVCTVNSSTGALTLVGAGSCEITVTAASTSNYNQATATYAVTVQAADMLVELSVAPATVGEHGPAATVTVTGTLAGGPRSADTAVSVSVGGPGDTATEGADYATVDDVTLTIEAGQTSGTVDVTLTPINDDIVEGDETLTVAGTTGVEDLAVTGAVVTIRDDERGVVVSPTSLSVSEGGSASYSVVLTSRPSGSVKVTISHPSGTDLQRSRGLIWFSRTNWSVAQTVTVTAHQDDDAEDDTVIISHAVSGADYGVNGVTADSVSVTIDDDDLVSTGVELSVNTPAVDEDASVTDVIVTGTLNGVARAAPTILTVSVGASDDAATAGTDYIAVDDLTLTIPSGQASGTATFTLTPLEDRIDEPDEAVSIAGTSQVAGFAVTGTTLSINDNDERGVTVSPSVLTLTEGATATYTVVLDTEPTQTVTVTPSVSGSPDVTFTPPSLTFTPSDWDTAQTMTVSATEDDDASHDSSIVIHTAQGAEYASLADGELPVTISDNEVASQDMLPAQVTGVSATATASHVELTWAVGEDTVLGYRVEASYDGGANWAAVEDHTESTDTTYRHDVGLNFAETRRYRVSAVGGNGAGLPSVFVQASATVTTGGLTATVAVPENATDAMSEDTPGSVPDDTTDPVPAVDLCWIPEGVDASELSDLAMAWTPVYSSSSTDLSDLPWQSIGSGSSEVDCEDGMGIRVTSISENQRYAFRMRANHGGAWLISNDAQAVWVDSSEPLRTVVTAGASGLSGDTRVPALICRNFNDPATREDEEGSFFISVGFTTAPPEYLRYEPVTGFYPSSDLTLVNATAERVDRPYDTRLGYRVRITPSVWGEPVVVSLAADVVTHEATSVGNQASGEFRRETSDSVDCDTSIPELARRSQVTAARFEQDGDRNGEWTIGELIRVTLQFDEPVHVTTTDGVPSVTLTIGEAATEATEQSSDGEAATEVTATFSRVAHEDTLVFEHLVTAQQSPIGDITLLADSLSLNGGEINSFSGPAVDLAHAEAAVVGGQFVLPELTASWPMIPGAHEGSESSFEIHLKFSEAVDLIEVIGEQNLLEHAFTVTGGSIEAIWPARDGGGEVLANQWAMRVLAASEEPVTIAPVVDLACDQPGAICTIDNRLLTAAPSVTVQRTERGLSVADAEVGEGPGAVLVFEVTLARTADHPVTVDYETADGTATAGQDYAAASGTLRIEAGQTTGRVRVYIIDDSHDEGEETLTLILANASNAQIHDGEALGIIVNSDPMPAAWLARFGRAASDHVAQAIARRLERGPREQHMTVGGLRLDRLFTSVSGPDDGRAASGSMHLDPDPLGSGAMAPASGLWAATGAGSRNGQPAGGWGGGSFSSMPMGGSDAQGSPGDMASSYARPLRGFDTLSSLRDALLGSSFALPNLHEVLMGSSFAPPSLRDVLMGSSFFYTYGEGDDASSGPWTAWGETASTRFSGSEGSLSLDGEVTTAMLGLDKRYGRWLVGSTLSYSEGEGGYQGSGAPGGSMHSTLASLSPYAHYELNDTTNLWGVIGYGSGRLRLTPQGAESSLDTELSNRMAAFGGRASLSVVSGDAGRFELALRSDALLTRTASEAVQGLVGAQGATRRLRLMLEGSGSMPVWGGMLSPTLEAGLRYDGGDAETGAGVEVSGGLGFAANRLTIEVNARVLVAHEDTDYEEWGFSGSLAYTPGEDGRGLSMRLGSAWGATQSGVQSLWNQQDASGLARNAAFEAALRFEAELGYGIGGRRRNSLWVPFIAAQAADGGGQLLRTGLKLTSGPNLEAGLEVGRSQGRPGTDPQHAVQLRGALRW